MPSLWSMETFCFRSVREFENRQSISSNSVKLWFIYHILRSTKSNANIPVTFRFSFKKPYIRSIMSDMCDVYLWESHVLQWWDLMFFLKKIPPQCFYHVRENCKERNGSVIWNIGARALYKCCLGEHRFPLQQILFSRCIIYCNPRGSHFLTEFITYSDVASGRFTKMLAMKQLGFILSTTHKSIYGHTFFSVKHGWDKATQFYIINLLISYAC